MAVKLDNIKKQKRQEKQEGAGNIFTREITLFSKELSAQKKEIFFKELMVLLESGVQLKPALDIIKQYSFSKKDKAVFEFVIKEITMGQNLSSALRNSKKFSDYDTYCIQIGEESGQLIKVLDQLHSYYGGRIKQKRAFTKALSYPIVIVSVSILALLFLLNFLVPMFSDLYQKMGSELPPFTKMVIAASSFFNQNFKFIVLLLLLIGIVYFTQRKKDWLRSALATILLKTPIVGPIVKKSQLARLSQAFSLLISANLPITQSVNLLSKMISFYPIQQSLFQIEKDLELGSPLNESMSKHSIYGGKFIAMIKIGEEVNQLDKMFERLTEQFNDEIEYSSSILSSVLEPLLIVFLAVIVGVVLIAMYLPLFKLSVTLQ